MGGARQMLVARSHSRKRRRPGFFSCTRWNKLKHGASTTILFGTCFVEEEPDTGAR
ncbi:hypothetical protein ACFXTI_014562 [Malus domestica]